MEGNIILQPEFSRIIIKDKGFLTQHADSKLWALFSAHGDMISPRTKEPINYISHHTFGVENNRVDIKGTPKGPRVDFNIGKEYYNYAVIYDREFKKSGLMNRETGEIILPVEYEGVIFLPPFTDRFYAKKDGKFGIVDLEGKFIVPNQYDVIYSFANSNSNQFVFRENSYQTQLRKVGIDKKFGLMDFKGDLWVEVKYKDNINPLYTDGFRDFAVVTNEDGKQGLVKFKLLKEPNEFFDRIFFTRGELYVKKDGKDYKATIKNGNEITY